MMDASVPGNNLPKLLLLGRPNVGKSTLYNRLIGKQHAIVYDAPGITRDIRETDLHLNSKQLLLLDTPGWQQDKSIDWLATQQAILQRAITNCDVILLTIDAKDGLLPDDYQVADMARKAGKPVIVAANKCESLDEVAIISDTAPLGFDPIIPISALHGDNIDLLTETVAAALPESHGADLRKPEICLNIIGRPNVGKSTLFNALLGEERALTGDMPGLTRDAIAKDWDYKGHLFRLVDTAGLRRKAKIQDTVEKASVKDSKHALTFAHVSVLVIDGIQGIDKQDLALARMIHKEGRALVIAVNKIDAMDDKEQQLKEIAARITYSLPQFKGVPVVSISALKTKGFDKMLQGVLDVFKLWNTRITTAKLNDWLSFTASRHPPPRAPGGAVKLRYMTQIKTRPPTFAVFCNRPDAIIDSYQSYMENRLRDDFKLSAIPLRVYFRGGANPYEGKKKRR